MHISSYNKMTQFVNQYLGPLRNDRLEILDVGSQDVQNGNGGYRNLFDSDSWHYNGCDMEAGANVDIVLENPYDWHIKSNSYDVVVSGQAFEHIEFVWVTMLEIGRVLKPGGLCCIIAPSGGWEHKFPVDCWRFYPDSFRFLARFAGLEVLDVYTEWEFNEYPDNGGNYHDSVLICKKPEFSLKRKFKYHLKNKLSKLVVRLSD